MGRYITPELAYLFWERHGDWISLRLGYLIEACPIFNYQSTRLGEPTHHDKLTTSHHSPDKDRGEDIRFHVLLDHLTRKTDKW